MNRQPQELHPREGQEANGQVLAEIKDISQQIKDCMVSIRNDLNEMLFDAINEVTERTQNKLQSLIDCEPFFEERVVVSCYAVEGSTIVDFYIILPEYTHLKYWKDKADARIRVCFGKGIPLCYSVDVYNRGKYTEAIKRALCCDFELALEDINGYPQSNK